MLAKKIIIKTFRISHQKVKKIKALLFSFAISDKKLLKLFNVSSKEEIVQYFKKREEPKFFLNSRKEISRFFRKQFLDIENIISRADEVCEHIFDLLGSGKTKLNKKINWHYDFKSGYSWDAKKYYQNIEIPYGKADIKVPWEFSRFQHLSLLGQAYWLTGNEKYTQEFVDEISDWIENNPPQYGVNWVCPMEAAIRICNWIFGFYFFKDSKEISDEFLLKFLKSLIIQGKHIEKNLEKSWLGKTSNHYLSDIVGLVYLGIFFKDTKIGKRWLKFGIRELKKEMRKQVYLDGSDFEASTCYHRLVLELFFFSTLLVIINDIQFKGKNHQEITEKIFGKEYREKLSKMFEVLLYTLKPNGKMPQIGDNDNGRLHILAEQEILDMRYSLSLGAIFFQESKFKVKEFGFFQEALWIFGEGGYKIWQRLKENSLKNIKSKAFFNSGWYLMREGKNYIIISAGPNGQNGKGGHCHNDKLSFELSVNQEDIIIDPGTYVYTPEPETRNLFRSTAYHNTVVVDGREQNKFNEQKLFSLEDNSQIKMNKWETNSDYDFFDAQYSGYVNLKEPVTHRRQIFFDKTKDYWSIKDILTGRGKHKFEWYFHLAPPVMVKKIKKNEFLLKNKKQQVNFKIVNSPSNLNLFVEDGWFSPQYGVRVRNKVLRLKFSSELPLQLEFIIQPLILQYG